MHVRPFRADQVARPESLDEGKLRLFTNQFGLMDLEIGCGVGWHPIRYAGDHPERALIAVEHTREKYARFLARLESHPNLVNLLPIHADAVRWITHALKPESLDRILLLYPNPERKARNKRWFAMPFMHRLLETLKVGGEFVLATNEHSYFDEARELATQYWKLELIEERAFTKETAPEGIPRTHFEKKYLERGETCYDMRLRKRNGQISIEIEREVPDHGR